MGGCHMSGQLFDVLLLCGGGRRLCNLLQIRQISQFWSKRIVRFGSLAGCRRCGHRFGGLVLMVVTILWQNKA